MNAQNTTTKRYSKNILKLKNQLAHNKILLCILLSTIRPIRIWSLCLQSPLMLYPILQNKKMTRCGMPPPPPIIFERLKLLQQIIYRRRGNLSEIPNHFKYLNNMLISRFYEQFSRSSRNLGHFWKFEQISNSWNINISYIILKA